MKITLLASLFLSLVVLSLQADFVTITADKKVHFVYESGACSRDKTVFKCLGGGMASVAQFETDDCSGEPTEYFEAPCKGECSCGKLPKGKRLEIFKDKSCTKLSSPLYILNTDDCFKIDADIGLKSKLDIKGDKFEYFIYEEENCMGEKNIAANGTVGECIDVEGTIYRVLSSGVSLSISLFAVLLISLIVSSMMIFY